MIYNAFFQTLDIRAITTIVILRDINGHIEDLNRYTDTTGNVLLDLCEEHDFLLYNMVRLRGKRGVISPRGTTF